MDCAECLYCVMAKLHKRYNHMYGSMCLFPIQKANAHIAHIAFNATY